MTINEIITNQNQNLDSSDNESEEDEKPHITSEEVKNCIGRLRTFFRKKCTIKKMMNKLLLQKRTESDKTKNFL